MKNQRGFTVYELLLVILFLAAASSVCWVAWEAVRLLMKFL